MIFTCKMLSAVSLFLFSAIPMPSSSVLNGGFWLAKQDATGKWGGSLIFSTSAAGTDSTTPSTQLADRLTIDSAGLATFTGSLSLTSTSSILRALGSTVLGTTGAQTLTVNAASSFASTATFTASTALTANGNVQLGATSGQALTVPASASFSAPVTVASTMSVAGLATFTGGAALTTPVTVNGTALASVATTNSYLSLQNRPLFYRGPNPSSSSTAGAPDSSAVVGTWFGTVVTGSAGVATANPTVDGTPTGAALFTSILSVQATANQTGVSSPTAVAFVAVKTISLDRKTVELVAVNGDRTLLGGTAPGFAASTSLMCTVFGTL